MSRADYSQWPLAGGEMGRRIRTHDWSLSSLGATANWPQAQRTAVDILLGLPLPAMLVWGPDLVQIPNDACYRLMGPSLAGALGQPVQGAVPDGWAFHGPLCSAVSKSGQPEILQKKRLVPAPEDPPGEQFFTLTYSPVPDGAGGYGVLLTIQRPDAKPHTGPLDVLLPGSGDKLRYERTRLLEDVFRLAPSFLYVLRGPGLIFEFANPAFYRLVGSRALLGRPLAEAIPEAVTEACEAAIADVLASGESCVGHELPVTVARFPGTAPEERHVNLVCQPLLDSDGHCRRVLVHGVDVTDHVAERRRNENALTASRERFQALSKALAAIAASAHRDEILQVVRFSVRQLTGADGASLVERNGERFRHHSEESSQGLLWPDPGLDALGCLARLATDSQMTVIIEDTQQDDRIPPGQPTPLRVRSLVMVPLGGAEPFAAVGAYWSRLHRPDPEDVAVLEVLTRAAQDILERRQTENRLRLSEARMAAIFARAPVGLAEISLEGQFLRVNDEMCRILDRTTEQLLCASVADVTLKADLEHSLAALQRLLATGGSEALDKRYERPDGSWVWASSSLTRLDDSRGQPSRILAVTVDLTKRVQAEQALRSSEERYRALADLSPEGILVYADKAIYYANAAAAQILGADAASQLIGRALLDFVDPELREEICLRLERQLRRDTSSALVEERWRRLDGTMIELEVSTVPVELEGSPALQVLLRDITDRKLAEVQIWHHANFCPLTRLPNRRLFRDRLDQEVRKAQRSGQGIGLLFIDLDDFKQVNDLLGHDAGDHLLVEAARRLERCVRESDTVARLGGDEFTVILGELEDGSIAEKVSQKIVAALSQAFHLGKEVAYVSASVGITVYPEDATTVPELIRRADQAMYAAKAAGKNQFSYFTHAMDEQAHLRLRLASELRNALRDGQLEVYYQPIVDLRQDTVEKAEALVRWRHPAFGLVEPSQFIPLAEDSGLIIDIGNWVFREAAVCAKRWRERFGAPFQVSVNKSPLQFLGLGKDDDWLGFLEELELPRCAIAVEITEGVLLHASKAVTERLLKYQEAGIQVAIDDFGTGYSSMAYLKKFDIDYLKIDRSFVADMPEEGANRTIAESIIVMAHKLGLKVIGEGVETAAQRDALVSAGCDYGQGFFFAHPLPAAEFEDVVSRMRKV